MTADLQSLCWPVSRLGEALASLARKSRLIRIPAEVSNPPQDINGQSDETLTRWLISATAGMRVEAGPMEVAYRDVERFLQDSGPMLVRLAGMSGACFLALIGGRQRSLLVLGPDFSVHALPSHQISSALCRNIETLHQKSIEQVMELAASAGMSKQKCVLVRAGLLRDRLREASVSGIWMLRLSPGASFFAQIRQAGLLRPFIGVISIYTVQYVLGLVSWVMIGRAALLGRFDPGWLAAWVLILVTCLPLNALVSWYEGVIAIGGSALMKRRLLYGALRLEPHEIRHQGAGQLLGRVFESQAIESLLLGAGFTCVLAVIEVVISVGVLAMGAGGWPHALLLIGWIVVAVYIGRIYWKKRRDWTMHRVDMTHDLVEKMVGHRTRLAQEKHGQWHQDEDQKLRRYAEISKELDHGGVLILALVPAGWGLLGLLGLAPAIISGRSSTAELAIGLGGVLLAAGALGKVTMGLASVAGAAISWRQVSQLFYAAGRPEAVGSSIFACARPATSNNVSSGRTIIDAHNLIFHHSNKGKPILQGLNLRILANERVLLEGPSGGGKSTLAALLSGLRAPQSGSILVGGLDWTTLGSEAWRRRIAMAPQFHENHILTETLAFNLLMGRRWPPKAEDLEDAMTICRELGLGDLLDKMPAGLAQVVGDSGWQLSHGERSRVYIARALLQQADLVILDESFAALDPENLFSALRCVVKRANALMVIAHP
jgi:ATP-binding cassette, subfamily B, bacterial